jgi:hypothetical protein
MPFPFRAILAVLLSSVSLVSAAAEIELVGKLAIPGDATDLSGLTDRLENTDHLNSSVPHNQLGGFSAIAHIGRGNRYLVLPDRGPADGAVAYRCRFHEVELTVQPGQQPPLAFRLVATHLLTDEQGRPFVGRATAIDAAHPERSLRFDPEGVRVGPDGTVWISDEYGPHLFGFSPQGRLLRRFPLPAHLRVARPSADPDEEHANNDSGRQSNRGLEGLAISADGRLLYPMLQGPLLQDRPFDDAGERLGRHVRLLECDLDAQTTRERVYVLEHPNHGISEVLRYDDRRLLVLERDSKAGDAAEFKRLYLADLSSATDITGRRRLPANRLRDAVQPVAKTLLLDLLAPQHGLTGAAVPAKVEGITFGPNLPDGRRLLLVCTDNDFQPDQPSWLYAFAIRAEE